MTFVMEKAETVWSVPEKDVKCSVKINGHYSEWFNVSVGLKQGCLMSPMLFNLYIDDLISEIKD